MYFVSTWRMGNDCFLIYEKGGAEGSTPCETQILALKSSLDLRTTRDYRVRGER